MITDLIESYLFQIRSLTLEAQEMLNLIANKIELAELNLDHNRNELMRFDMKLSFFTAAMDSCCFFGGLFGMNVIIPMNNRKGVWITVVVLVLAVSASLYLFLLQSEKRRDKKNNKGK